MKHTLVTALMMLAVVAQAPAQSPVPINTLLITGHNNHNWQFTSRLHKDTLEATGRFAVDITDTPQTTLADAAALAQYQLLVLDYNDYNDPKRWGDAAEQNFVDAVRSGTDVVAIHSANNAFKGWTEYEQMLGLMWREGTGHGPFHPFDVTFFNRHHPITQNLPDLIGHPDELYHRLVNSQAVSYEVIAEAESLHENGGSGQTEPMAIVLKFGKGRIFATALGHVWTNEEKTKASVCDPQFKALLCRGAEWAATGEVTLGPKWEDVVSHNVLSAKERADGWTLLFDGISTANFRGYKQDSVPAKGWVVRDGMLIVEQSGGGGDLVTIEQYGDFEFECDWKVKPGGNSGIIYRCTEDHEYSWQTGLEMQILDNAGHADGKEPKTSAGSLYAILSPAPGKDLVRPAGEWNRSRIVARGSKIEHWLNGFKILEIDMSSDEYKQLRSQSKWTKHPEMGTRAHGHIALQDHGDEVAFRAIKVRPLN
jgi:type 1 glutamine amidotransferase